MHTKAIECLTMIVHLLPALSFSQFFSATKSQTKKRPHRYSLGSPLPLHAAEPPRPRWNRCQYPQGI